MRVRLAAAEVGLELDDRVALGLPARRRSPVTRRSDRPGGQERALEEAARVAVLVAGLAAGDLAEVGRELGLRVAAGGDVGMRLDDVAPGPQARSRRTLERQGHLALLLLLLGGLPRGAQDLRRASRRAASPASGALIAVARRAIVSSARSVSDERERLVGLRCAQRLRTSSSSPT